MSYEGNEEFWFRFIALSESDLRTLREICAVVESRGKKNAPGRYVASFRLEEGHDYGWVREFVRGLRANESEYGIFVSLSTPHDSEIVTLPQFVLDLYRNVGGGKIEFSFTVTSAKQ